MLLVTDKSKSKGTYDQRVKSTVHQICRLWDELEDFERVYKMNIGAFPRLNTFIAEQCYKLIKPNDNTIEVWHLNTQSEPDRLLVEIIYKPKTSNNN